MSRTISGCAAGVPGCHSLGRNYGDYILRTGTGSAGELELLYGAHWFQTRFRGKRPILDLGPGRCWFTKQDIGDIIAVDNAPELVEYYSRQGIAIRLGSADAIPFPSDYFEAVFCCWLLEHLWEPARAMEEIRRVLKPGGYACIIVPSASDMAAFYDDYTHVRPFTPASLRQLAEDARFSAPRIEYLPWCRGLNRILRWLGKPAAARYLNFGDRILRRIHLLNRKHLMLEAWK